MDEWYQVTMDRRQRMEREAIRRLETGGDRPKAG